MYLSISVIGHEARCESLFKERLGFTIAGSLSDQKSRPSSTSFSFLDQISVDSPGKFLVTSHISYADDVLLLAKTPEGIRECWGKLTAFLHMTGMTLSSSKCVVALNKRFSLRYPTFSIDK